MKGLIKMKFATLLRNIELSKHYLLSGSFDKTAIAYGLSQSHTLHLFWQTLKIEMESRHEEYLEFIRELKEFPTD